MPVFTAVKEKVMRKVEKLILEYMGYAQPETDDELIMEVLGLELAKKRIEERVAMLQLSQHLARMSAREE